MTVVRIYREAIQKKRKGVIGFKAVEEDILNFSNQLPNFFWNFLFPTESCIVPP